MSFKYYIDNIIEVYNLKLDKILFIRNVIEILYFEMISK